MSIVHMDGFDSYASLADLNQEYPSNNSSFVAVSLTGGRYGGGGVILTNSAAWISRTFSPLAELWCGYAVNISSTYASSPGGYLAQFLGGAGAEFSVTYYVGTLKFTRGTASGTLVGTYSVTISTGAWHWLEVRYKYSATVGVCEVWLDGVQLATYSGNTTLNSSGSVNQFQIGGATYWINGYIDDLYILDATQGANTTRLGDSRIETLVPTANGATNNGAASAGANYACVNDATWNTTNYVTIPGTTGQTELYEMSDLTSSAYVVYGARAMAISQKSDAGPSLLKLVAVSGGTESDSAGIPTLCGSWSRQYAIYETDPHTSAAWTASAVNAVQAGVKVA